MKKKLNILHIEDNPGDLMLLEEILADAESHDIHITSSTTLKEAMQSIDNQTFDVILLDLGLPDSMGLQGLEVVLQKADTIPVIVLTGLDDDSVGQEAVKLGAQSYMIKGELSTATAIQSMVFAIERNQVIIKIRKAEEELKKKNLLLEEANSAKDRLLSIISHDLKSPMSSVVGLLSILNEEYDDFDETKKREYLKICYDNSHNTFQLIETLLAWAQSQSNRRRVAPVEFSLKDLAIQSYSPLIQVAKTKDITISVEIENDFLVFADHEMINTIFRNLISNAIKFSHQGGRIEIGASCEDEKKALVYVKDYGVGIEKDNQEKILDIRQGYSTLGTSDERGTGFGLILCKEFVEKNNGELWIVSEKDKGTTVYFSLPVKA